MIIGRFSQHGKAADRCVLRCSYQRLSQVLGDLLEHRRLLMLLEKRLVHRLLETLIAPHHREMLG